MPRGAVRTLVGPPAIGVSNLLLLFRTRHGGQCIELVFGRGFVVQEPGRAQPAPVDPQVEYVEAVVVSGDVVHLAGLDAAAQIDVRITDALAIDEGFADHPAVRAEDAR